MRVPPGALFAVGVVLAVAVPPTAGRGPFGLLTAAAMVVLSAAGLLLSGLAGLVGVPIAAGLLAVAATAWLVLSAIGAGQLTTAVRRTLP